MPTVTATDLAWVRLSAPDMAASRSFLNAFGLTTVDADETTLYSRGTDGGARCHILQVGEPSFVGAAFHLSSGEDLAAAATLEGASAVEPLRQPGGGHRVSLRDPEGFAIELVHGVELLDPLPIDHHPTNTARGRQRADGTFYRRPAGPAKVKRLGHYVTSSPDVARTRAWYRKVLGLIGSDDVYAGDEENVIATFNRLARGDQYVDHHVFMTHKSPQAGINHLGFEVQDADDIFFGETELKEGGYVHAHGPGRHMLGSQVFNQWNDPWGLCYEHWTDTDVLNEASPFSMVPASLALKPQWGTAPASRLVE